MKTGFLLALMLLLHNNMYSQVKFQKAYGGSADENVSKMVKTIDGGYILVGSTFSYGSAGLYENMYVVKTNALGDVVWKKTYGGIDKDIAEDVIQTSDGGYAILGGSRSFVISGIVHALLIKTDNSGNILWSKSYYAYENEAGFRIKQTTDGGYILACESFSSTSSDVLLIKTDASGNVIWRKSYGDYAHLETPRAIEQLPDNGYVVSTFLGDITTSDMDISLLRTDSNGNIIWQNRLHAPSQNYQCAVHYAGTNIWVAGTTIDSISGISHFLLIKLDMSGNILWNKTYGSTLGGSFCQDMIFTADSSIILLGETTAFGHPPYNDALLVKTDYSGNILWQRCYGTSTDELMKSVSATADGGFVLAGNVVSIGSGANDFYLVKTNNSGISSCYEDTAGIVSQAPLSFSLSTISGSDTPTVNYITNPAAVLDSGGNTTVACISGSITLSNADAGLSHSISIRPNPTKEKFKIGCPAGDGQRYRVAVYDVSGREFLSQQLYSEDEVDVSGLMPGTYFVKYISAEGVVSNNIFTKL